MEEWLNEGKIVSCALRMFFSALAMSRCTCHGDSVPVRCPGASATVIV